MKTTTARQFTGAAGAAVVLGILVAINALFAGVRVRKDLTAEKLYTLAPGTVQMLQNLPRPVTLKFYFSQGNPNVPAAVKNYVQRTLDFLREAADRSRGRLTLEVWDPKPDSEAEEWAQRYGLIPQATGRLGFEPDVYLGLAAVSGTREAAIPFLDPSAEPQLEYLVARLIQEVVRDRRPRIGVMSALPVLAPPAPPFAPPRKPDWLFVNELKKQYDVVPVALDAEEIPADLDAVLLAHPKGVSERALFALDQYLLKGGKLLAFVDPLCISEEKQEDWAGGTSLESDLNRLTRAWGVTLESNRVVADVTAATPVNIGDGRVERLATWLSLRGDLHIDREEIATSGLENLMLPFAGVFRLTPAEGLTAKTLLQASSNAVTLNTFRARLADDITLRGGAPAAGAALAVRLTGRFPTAFPDGPPATATNDADSAAASWLKEAEKDGLVILVADADLLANDFSARTVQFFGQMFFQPFNDNLSLTLNLAEQATGDAALVGLRSRGRFSRPFERVLALEQAAQERWQAEELKLQEKLMQTQQRLNELQAAKSEDQQLVLSPEQKAEIEKFRRERFETQRQLKEVRKNLRRSIERLGLTLKVLNMAAVPMLVAVFGVVHGWRRRRQALG